MLSSNLDASLRSTGAMRKCRFRASVTTLFVNQAASSSNPDSASVLSTASLAGAGKRPGGRRGGARLGEMRGGRRWPMSVSKPRGMGVRGSWGSKR